MSETKNESIEQLAPVMDAEADGTVSEKVSEQSCESDIDTDNPLLAIPAVSNHMSVLDSISY